MGYRSGIYVSRHPIHLEKDLAERLEGYGLFISASRKDTDQEISPEDMVLVLTQWRGGWSRIQVSHEDPRSRLVLDAITLDEPIERVIHCRYEPDRHEFSYSYFLAGKVVEAFSSAGAAMPAVEFISDLRTVPLHSMVESRRFMIESLKGLGIEPYETVPPEEGDIRIVLSSAKESVLKKLLGALWSGG